MGLQELDSLFSEFIRKRAVAFQGGCEYCGRGVSSYLALECSHFHRGNKMSTRFDPDNACGLCGGPEGCHLYLGENPYAHTEFFKKRLGSQRFEELNIRAETLLRYSKFDKEQLKAKLKSQIAFLEQSKGADIDY